MLRVSLAHARFIFGVDWGRDRRKTVGEIGADAEHGHRLEGQICVVLGRWTGERVRGWVQRILGKRGAAGRGCDLGS